MDLEHSYTERRLCSWNHITDKLPRSPYCLLYGNGSSFPGLSWSSPKHGAPNLILNRFLSNHYICSYRDHQGSGQGQSQYCLTSAVLPKQSCFLGKPLDLSTQGETLPQITAQQHLLISEFSDLPNYKRTLWC